MGHFINPAIKAKGIIECIGGLISYTGGGAISKLPVPVLQESISD